MRRHSDIAPGEMQVADGVERVHVLNPTKVFRSLITCGLTALTVMTTGCVETVPVTESPISLNLPTLEIHGAQAEINRSGLSGTYEALVRYEASAPSQGEALIRLQIRQPNDTSDDEELERLKSKLGVALGRAISEKMLNSCNMESGTLPDPLTELESKTGKTFGYRERIRSDTTLRDYGSASLSHPNHVESVSVRSGIRQCVGFKQCLPSTLTPAGWRLAVVSGFYCLPAGEKIGPTDADHVADAIHVRPDLVPRP